MQKKIERIILLNSCLDQKSYGNSSSELEDDLTNTLTILNAPSLTLNPGDRCISKPINNWSLKTLSEEFTPASTEMSAIIFTRKYDKENKSYLHEVLELLYKSTKELVGMALRIIDKKALIFRKIEKLVAIIILIPVLLATLAFLNMLLPGLRGAVPFQAQPPLFQPGNEYQADILLVVSECVALDLPIRTFTLDALNLGEGNGLGRVFKRAPATSQGLGGGQQAYQQQTTSV